MGRRTKATDGRLEALFTALRAGNTRRAAAAHAEIHHATFYRWLDEDATFRDGVEKAEADAEVRFEAIVARAAQDGTWQAAAWWLERRRFNDYSQRQKVEMTGKDGGPIEQQITSGLDDHEKALLKDAVQGELARRADARTADLAVGDPRPEGADTTGG